MISDSPSGLHKTPLNFIKAIGVKLTLVNFCVNSSDNNNIKLRFPLRGK
uniref:Uncharacterized protein n=1 Tax=Anguilla anguilla TaxID=7936 RepID=A0A0E9SMJ8_ANGAN